MSETDKVWLWLVGLVVAAGTVIGLVFAGFDATAGVVGTVAIFVMVLIAVGLIFTWWDSR